MNAKPTCLGLCCSMHRPDFDDGHDDVIENGNVIVIEILFDYVYEI